ncbi:immunoglobulin-like domain-containing receptor 2 isoform X2 [Scleropages formosus]|uniref:immunoglobulin-like domain-containing receptor 2 isoform X2 n=1 Tax=Scleropages formosus TaxID=113540 RepID=UPI0010FA7EAF|nr:immunoglobulin-like domain-containing receptor 2 isoform X2 [Scleropages formosus]
MSVRAGRLVLLCVCLAVTGGAAVHVTVADRQRHAMLFQPVELRCHFSSSSSQVPVVQWWYKSYCHDDTRSSFGLPQPPVPRGPGSGADARLDCADSGRTVRPVASGQGSSMTLGEYYRGRDIAIINKADLRIKQLQWGDTGVYFCKVIISDDLVGQNEAQVELLVLGRMSAADDLLPDIDVEIMPEWVFVAAVTGGGVAVLLLVALCWCQCCPHSCCCYVRCCCCPETCCCPRHLYEAGKVPKTAQVALYPHYYMPSVPTVVSTAPPSLVSPKATAVASAENRMTRAQSVSELSSLRDGESNGHHTYRHGQRMELEPKADHRDGPRDSDVLPPQSRWKPRSEHLQRKPLGTCGRTRSLDELEDFASSCDRRGRWTEFRGVEDSYGLEMQNRSLGAGPRLNDERDGYRSRRHGKESTWGHRLSPPPSPRGEGRNYDDALLSSLLEEKARGRVGGGEHYSNPSPSNRTEEEDSLPPYTERSTEPSAWPFSYQRSPSGPSYTLQERRQERPRKTNTLLSRDALIV